MVIYQEQYWYHPVISKQGTYRNIVDAPWYIRNADLHRDLQMETVTNEIEKFAKKHEERLLHHVNVEAIQLLDKSEMCEGLKGGGTFWADVVKAEHSEMHHKYY